MDKAEAKDHGRKVDSGVGYDPLEEKRSNAPVFSISAAVLALAVCVIGTNKDCSDAQNDSGDDILENAPDAGSFDTSDLNPDTIMPLGR